MLGIERASSNVLSTDRGALITCAVVLTTRRLFVYVDTTPGYGRVQWTSWKQELDLLASISLEPQRLAAHKMTISGEGFADFDTILRNQFAERIEQERRMRLDRKAEWRVVAAIPPRATKRAEKRMARMTKPG